jgi:hypothetical protein
MGCGEGGGGKEIIFGLDLGILCFVLVKKKGRGLSAGESQPVECFPGNRFSFFHCCTC